MVETDTELAIQRAIEELTDLIKTRYPSASFAVRPGVDDPEATYITATVDIEDPDEVMDLVIDRLLELQLNENLPIYVLPIHTPERAHATMRRYTAQQRPHAPSSLAPAPPR